MMSVYMTPDGELEWVITNYDVSIDGHIKRKDTGRVCSQYKSPKGYKSVYFSNEVRRFGLLVHRIVAYAYVPGYATGLTVDHIDGDKGNNHASNLRWVTRATNTKSSFSQKLQPNIGSNHHSAKIDDMIVLTILSMPHIKSPAFAEQYDLHKSSIKYIRAFKTWRCITEVDLGRVLLGDL